MPTLSSALAASPLRLDHDANAHAHAYAHATASTTPSLFSRIKAKTPFSTKSRTILDFYIQPDDPHRQYSPGDITTGSVILKVAKPLRVTHVTACLHGFVQVYKTANHAGESHRAHTTGTGTSTTGYFGNGFASLFQDEVTLCGEGRLVEGTYQFGYELMFPKARLPSSIDFERGTISYMITATLTKPTAISPTTTCDRSVSLTEDLDVARLPKPKPRTIMLEPLSRSAMPRHITKKRARAAAPTVHTDSRPQGQAPGPGPGPGPGQPDAAAAAAASTSQGRVQLAAQTDGDSLTSPARSDTSFDSCLSSSGGGTALAMELSGSTTKDNKQPAPAVHHDHRPISATIELAKQGFLRGDAIHVRIGIQHRKLLKSLHGVIVTLYRQARVDMHPALPVVGKDGHHGHSGAAADKNNNNNDDDNKNKAVADDYYPKSKTGLGGLSLSSAGSSHVFRKDLSQSFASIIVNPDTLTAEVKAAVRVPDGAFPTISTVPGAMISFKYYVEVVLDLQGKLSGLDRLFPTGMSATGVAGADQPNGRHMMDTLEIRREKSVVSCVFEVVVGTRDSERGAVASSRPQLQQPVWADEQATADAPAQQQQQQQQPGVFHGGMGAEMRTQPAYALYDPAAYSSIAYAADDGAYAFDPHDGFCYGAATAGDVEASPPPSLPHLDYPPRAADDDDDRPPADEKLRLHLAEARLLPSAPAPDPDCCRASAEDGAPSAPPPPPASEVCVAASAPDGLAVADDKLELDRRRLESERSAPGDGEGEGEGEGEEERPSAPVLGRCEGEGDGDGDVVGLPRYVR